MHLNNIIIDEPNRLQKNRDKEGRIIAVLAVLFPIFHRYRSIIPIFTVSEFITFTYMAYYFLKQRVMRLNMRMLSVAALLILASIWALVVSPENIALNTALSTLRIALTYFFVAVLATRMDYEYGINFLIRFSSLIGIYEILQIIFARMSIYLTTYIPFLPIYDGFNKDEFILSQQAVGLHYRPYSLLNEPAALGCYLALPLLFCLMRSKQNSKYFLGAIFFSSCGALTASSTSVFCIALIWGIFLLKDLKKGTISRKSLFIVVLLVPVIVMMLMLSDGWQYILNTAFQGKIGFSGLLQSDRFRDLGLNFTEHRSTLEIIFGSGLKTREGYLPGWIWAYHGLGIVGLLTFVFFYVWCYKQGNSEQKFVTIIFAFLNIGTEIMLGCFVVYYVMFILCQSKKTVRHEWVQISE